MTATLEGLRAKQAKELAEFQRTDTIKQAVTEALGLSEANWGPGFMHVHKADCCIKMEADTLPDAIELAEKMEPVTLARMKGTFLSFRAFDMITEKEEAENTVEIICPWTYRIDGLRQYAEDKTLIFYVKVAGYLVKVEVAVKNDPDTRRDFKITFDRHGNASRTKNDITNKSGYFPKVARFWSSPEHPSGFTLWSY